MRKTRTPSYRLHKATGQAVVTLSGKDHYLGKHGTPGSRTRYDAVIARWLNGGREDVATPLTIRQLVAMYKAHVSSHYLKGGELTTGGVRAKHVCDELDAMFGHEAADAFGVRKFKAIRAKWIGHKNAAPEKLPGGRIKRSGSARDLARSTVNLYAGVILDMFRWGVEEEHVPPIVLFTLKSVRSLQAGRGTVRETTAIRPVPEADIEAVIKAGSTMLGQMINLQLLTGMRPGEVCSIKPKHIDRSGPTWIYTPPDHKTSHKGIRRTIVIGPEAKAILESAIDGLPPDDLAFLCMCRPVSRARRRLVGVGRNSRGQVYGKLIRRICLKVGIDPPWHPHQLRHNAATRFRKLFGIERTRMLLGHSSVAMTEAYAEPDLPQMIEDASKAS